MVLNNSWPYTNYVGQKVILVF